MVNLPRYRFRAATESNVKTDVSRSARENSLRTMKRAAAVAATSIAKMQRAPVSAPTSRRLVDSRERLCDLSGLGATLGPARG